MRLGLVRYEYHQAGGAERTLGLLCRGLLERGHQVTVIASRWQGEPPAGLELELISPRGHPASWARRAADRAGRLGLDSWLSLERVPGAPLFRAGDGCHAAWLRRRARHEGPLRRLSFRLNPKHRAILALERATLGSPALFRVLANSRLVGGELLEYYGLGPDRVEVLYNPVDLGGLFPDGVRPDREQARAALDLAGPEPVLLFLGSGFRRKGLVFALAALARLAGARLLVAGRGNQADAARAARRLGVAGRVQFLGPRRDVGLLLTACDAMVLPTMYDPCANACLEALALGRPVVTTTANGAAEFIRPGVNGAVVEDPADAEALAGAVEQTLGLGEFPPPELPSADEWAGRIAEIMEQAGRAGAE